MVYSPEQGTQEVRAASDNLPVNPVMEDFEVVGT